MPGHDVLPLVRLAYRQARERIHAARERRAERRGDVLRDHDGRAIGRQAHEEFADGFGAAGGSAHGDDAIRGPEHAAHRRRGRGAGRRNDGVGGMFGNHVAHGTRPRDYPRARGRADLGQNLFAEIGQCAGHVHLGLGDKVDRTQLQRLQRGLGAALGQRGHHHHGHGPQPHEIREEGDAIHARHFHVEREHVRFQFLDALASHERVAGRAHDFDVVRGLQYLDQDLAHQRRIVDHEDFDFLAHGQSGKRR